MPVLEKCRLKQPWDIAFKLAKIKKKKLMLPKADPMAGGGTDMATWHLHDVASCQIEGKRIYDLALPPQYRLYSKLSSECPRRETGNIIKGGDSHAVEMALGNNFYFYF